MPTPGPAPQSSDDEPIVIPFPVPATPLNYQVDYLEYGGQVRTIIARAWRSEDALICTLCPESECNASPGLTGKSALCLKIIPWFVPEEEVALFRYPTGFPRGSERRPGSMS